MRVKAKSAAVAAGFQGRCTNDHAIRNVDDGQAASRACALLGWGGESREHRIQCGKRNRGAQSPEQGASVDVFTGKKIHCVALLIWKGRLFTIPETKVENR